MALGTYAELQTSLQNELRRTGTAYTDAIPDLILRCEVKMNRRLRLREMETLAYATYAVGTNAIADRLLALPAGYVEMLQPLRAKKSTEDDTKYIPLTYLDPQQISDRYGNVERIDGLCYTLRDQIEFSAATAQELTIMMHYLKKWDLATDTTNWLLTNYPDAYLYGALMESELFLRDDARAGTWKQLYDEAIHDLNELSNRGRDDAELDVSEIARISRSDSFSIIYGEQ